MNYDEMGAGPEMDRLIAEKVMGWKEYHCEGGYTDTSGYIRITDKWASDENSFHPSTNIANAWEVVEEIVADRQDSAFELFFRGKDGWGVATTDNVRWALGDTAPLAICRAALKAVQ